MDTTSFTPEEVAAFERTTWNRCADGYADGFARLTGEAGGALLDAAGVRSGTRLLDVGTGTGSLAAAAIDRGAVVTAIDFAEAMVDQAGTRVPDATVRAASADDLPFDDVSFDAVVANGVLHHLGRPAQALAEAARVLASGGRVAATVWDAPERLEAFGLFFAAVARHAGEADLPHGPLFGVADPTVLSALFADNGFHHVTVETLPTVWRMEGVDTLLRAFGAWANLDAFPERTRRAIEESVTEAAEVYRSDGGLAVPNPMVLVSAAVA